MPKMLILDSYYPEALQCLPKSSSSPERALQLCEFAFGTSNFYSEAFASMGWETHDIVANDDNGRELHNLETESNIKTGVEWFVDVVEILQPDVVCYQDLSFIPWQLTNKLRATGKVKLFAGFHSCPWTGDGAIGALDVVFSSFPHYIDRINALCARGEFLQLGFGSRMYEEWHNQRPIPVSFVGGLGRHWNKGQDVLEYVASKIEGFEWYGYGQEQAGKALSLAHCGQAWGQQMYDIYNASKIVINRHGEVAQGYANNLRLFEATGCGAMLITERSPNLNQYFKPGEECETYSSKEDLVSKINYYLANDKERQAIAQRGQDRTMRDHTYDTVLRKASDILKDMLPK